VQRIRHLGRHRHAAARQGEDHRIPQPQRRHARGQQTPRFLAVGEARPVSHDHQRPPLLS
jgi:hypothetical protein